MAAFILLAVAINACHKQKLQDVLAANCYWDILEQGADHPINSCYRFYKDGKCQFFYYNFFNKKKTDTVFWYDDGDVVVPDLWKDNGGSLSIRGADYSIVNFNPDTISLLNKNGQALQLIKNCATVSAKGKKER
jgi:hypothetical protein